MNNVFYNLEVSFNKEFLTILRNEYWRTLDNAIETAEEWIEICKTRNTEKYFRIIRIDMRNNERDYDLESNIVWQGSSKE